MKSNERVVCRMKNRTYYYKSYTDDFIESKDQQFKLPENYSWITNNLLNKILSFLLYKVATIFCLVYCKCVLRVNVENKDILKKYKKSGYFLFGNHTQTIGDAFIPTYVCNGRRVYVVVSSANLGIPLLGKILPMLGALPIPDSIHGMSKLKKAIQYRAKNGNVVVVYPEGHLWPYYTGIRPFSPDSFRFPIESDVPVFSMTTTYQKSKFRLRPKITIYIDGPFLPNKSLTGKMQRQDLRDRVYDSMINRSKNSTYEYIHYEEEK